MDRWQKEVTLLWRKTKYEGRSCKTFSRTKAENTGNNMEVPPRRSSRDKRKDKRRGSKKAVAAERVLMKVTEDQAGQKAILQ